MKNGASEGIAVRKGFYADDADKSQDADDADDGDKQNLFDIKSIPALSAADNLICVICG
jgi:hypothetical protein